MTAQSLFALTRSLRAGMPALPAARPVRSLMSVRPRVGLRRLCACARQPLDVDEEAEAPALHDAGDELHIHARAGRSKSRTFAEERARLIGKADRINAIGH